MKRTILLALIVLTLAACSADPGSTTTQETLAAPVVSVNQGESVNDDTLAGLYLNTDFEDATSVRNQLAYGTLLLEETEFAITPEQAQILLPLYQAMVSLTGDATSNSEEVNAVQNQIVESMTPEQLNKIAELQITTTMLNAFYLEKGVTMPSLSADSTGVPGSGGGMGKNLDPEAREATRTALGITETGSGQGSGALARTLLFDEVILMLTDRMAE